MMNGRCTVFTYHQESVTSLGGLCYWVHVTSTSDCDSSAGDQLLGTDVYTLTGSSAPQPPYNEPPLFIPETGEADDELTNLIVNSRFGQMVADISGSDGRRYRGSSFTGPKPFSTSGSSTSDADGEGDGVPRPKVRAAFLTASTQMVGPTGSTLQSVAASQLQSISAFEHPPFGVKTGAGGSTCGVTCTPNKRLRPKQRSDRSGIKPPSTSHKLALALSELTETRKAEDTTMGSICPALMDNSLLPDFIKDMCTCEPSGAFGFILYCAVSVPNPFGEDGDPPLFTISLELAFAPCANVPNFGFVIALDGWDEHPYAVGPYIWDGEITPIPLPTPFTWGISFFNKGGKGSRDSGRRLEESWIMKLLRGLTLEAGAVVTLRLEGNLHHTMVSVGMDLCATGPFGLGEFCLGEYDTTAELFHMPLWFAEDWSISFDKIFKCPTPVWEQSKRTLSQLMQGCLDDLDEDYATCGMSKREADERFVLCARGAFTPQELAYHDSGGASNAANTRPPPPPPAAGATVFGGDNVADSLLGAAAALANPFVSMIGTPTYTNPPSGVYGDPGVFTTPPPFTGGCSDTGLTRWWLLHLIKVDLPEAAVAELANTFDCERYWKAQQSACVCRHDIKIRPPTPMPSQDGPMVVVAPKEVESKPVLGHSMGCVGSSVGMKQDPLAANSAQDMVVVRDRLDDLGYVVDGTDHDIDHPMRVLQCAASRVVTFEDACDPGTVPCAVGNVTCPGARATPRGTCLRNETCAVGRVAPVSLAMDWLRATNAPKWRRLPERGPGFLIKGGGERGSNPRQFGTHWLSDALTRAGRRYELVRSKGMTKWSHALLTARGASTADGGAIPGREGFQSGMELELEVPILPQTSAELREERRARMRRKMEQMKAEAAAQGADGQAFTEGGGGDFMHEGGRGLEETCTLDTVTGCSTGVARGLTLQIIAEMNRRLPELQRLVEQPTAGPGPHLGCADDACNPFMTKAAGEALMTAISANGDTALNINSAFRSAAQQYLLSKWHSEGQCNIGTAATVGRSNHEGGNALDMNSASVDHWRLTLESNDWTWYCTENNRGFATGCTSTTCKNPQSWQGPSGAMTLCDGLRTLLSQFHNICARPVAPLASSLSSTADLVPTPLLVPSLRSGHMPNFWRLRRSAALYLPRPQRGRSGRKPQGLPAAVQ